MFGFFTRKSTAPAVALVAPATPPADEDYILTDKQQEKFEALEANADGFVEIGDVTHGLLNMQSQYISRYMDGSPNSPMLVNGLRVNVDSPSHHEYTIHKDDVLEFVARVKAHRRMR